MSSVCQMLTRRYHGLLVAAVDPPVERFVLLAKLDATLTINEQTFELATNEYRDTLYPQGYEQLESFTARPYPTWRWRAGGAIIEQTLCMVSGEDTTFVRYRLVEGCRQALLRILPLCTSRHFHWLTQARDMGQATVEESDDSLTLRWPGNRPHWHLSHNGRFKPAPDWHYGFFLATEAGRGYDAVQDLFVPGTITANLECGDEVGLVCVASTQARSWHRWRVAFDQAALNDVVSSDGCAGDDPLVEPLVRATRDFLVARKDGARTVIAGYPWFGDWGRDTFISLPGLCLIPGRLDEARDIIRTFARYVDDGLIPNRFPDFGEPPAYNTVDAALWYVHAIDRYLVYSGDWALVAEQGLFEIIAGILDAYEQGTRHSIRLDDDGLLAAGEPGLALTWMDAKVADQAITPRIGKPVEINALWYNALRIAAGYADRLGDGQRARRWRENAEQAQSSFNKRFWNKSTACLYDVLDVNHQPGTADGAIRPNQLLAISLTHPILAWSRWRQVVDRCERRLWTPMGLRTLSPSDESYRGRYGGDLATRDEAYHQGTVWPWLLGPFVTAYVKAFCDVPPRATGLGRGGSATQREDHSHAARALARTFLEGLAPHFGEAGIGGVSEVADGDVPHTPGGCPWQAWSVAEPLRALCEDILLTHPPCRDGRPW